MVSLIDSEPRIHVSESVSWLLFKKNYKLWKKKYLQLLDIRFKFYYLLFYSRDIYLYCHLFDTYTNLYFNTWFTCFLKTEFDFLLRVLFIIEFLIFR